MSTPPHSSDRAAADPGRRAPRRRDILKVAAAAPLMRVVRGRAPRRPSLLLLVSDDQSRDDLGAYGNADCTTPHLDRLAGEGARFQRAFTQVSICRPSRTSLLTGLEAHRHGAMGFEPLRDDVPTWPELMDGRAATALVGKLGTAPEERFPFQFLRRYAEQDRRSPEAYASSLREFLTDVGESPFAAVVSFFDPHRPFQRATDPARRHAVEDVQVPSPLLGSLETRDDLAMYYDNIGRLDDAVAQVLAVLEESGRAGETLVIFTSDNGRPFPFGKTTLYEAGINLPFLVRWPGVVEPGSVSDAMVALTDLLPTALELAGAPLPNSLQGRSLLPLLRGEVDSVRSELFLEHHSHRAGHAYPMRGVRTARFKYIRNLRHEAVFQNSLTGVEGEGIPPSPTWRSWLEKAEENKRFAKRVHAFQHRPPEELYDLSTDPYETRNAVAEPDRAADLKRLRASVRGWMEREGDPLLAEWGD